MSPQVKNDKNSYTIIKAKEKHLGNLLKEDVLVVFMASWSKNQWANLHVAPGDHPPNFTGADFGDVYLTMEQSERHDGCVPLFGRRRYADGALWG